MTEGINTGDLHCLVDGCKPNRKPTLDMIRCCMCCVWYHYRCVDIDPKDASEIGVWPCPSCRTIASNVNELLSKMDGLLKVSLDVQQTNSTLNDKVNTLTGKLDDLNDELVNCRQEYTKLREENQTLRTQVGELTSKLHKTVWSSFHKDKSVLLIGDSALQAIDPKKLVKTQVVVKPSSRVADISKHLDECSDTYSKIIVQAGSTECTDEDLDQESVITAYKELIEKAKTKVMSAADVTVSSILPRTDSVDNMARIERINSCLCNAARTAGVIFTDSHQSFKLEGGVVCDFFLKDDGIQLTDLGTQQLVKSLKLSVKAGYEKNVCRSSPTSNYARPHRKEGNTDDPQREQPSQDWQFQRRERTQGSRKHHNSRSNYTRGPRERPGDLPVNRHGERFKPLSSTQDDRTPWSTTRQWHHRQMNEKVCGFCGEDNHQEDRCKWGEPIACNSCGGLGHKAKFHQLR